MLRAKGSNLGIQKGANATDARAKGRVENPAMYPKGLHTKDQPSIGLKEMQKVEQQNPTTFLGKLVFPSPGPGACAEGSVMTGAWEHVGGD